ncbi:hypothetical protein U1Q18_051291, partial [Sarracenia purpurea var. burkii]
KRPVISAPRPVNPVHLNGRKWKHVIVTIPIIDEPPVPPARKKRKPCSRKADTLAACKVDVDTADATGSTKKMSFFRNNERYTITKVFTSAGYGGWRRRRSSGAFEWQRRAPSFETSRGPG